MKRAAVTVGCGALAGWMLSLGGIYLALYFWPEGLMHTD